MAKMWVKPRGKSMVLVEEDEVERIIKANEAIVAKNKEPKKVVKKKKIIKEDKE